VDRQAGAGDSGTGPGGLLVWGLVSPTSNAGNQNATGVVLTETVPPGHDAQRRSLDRQVETWCQTRAPAAPAPSRSARLRPAPSARRSSPYQSPGPDAGPRSPTAPTSRTPAAGRRAARPTRSPRPSRPYLLRRRLLRDRLVWPRRHRAGSVCTLAVGAPTAWAPPLRASGGWLPGPLPGRTTAGRRRHGGRRWPRRRAALSPGSAAVHESRPHPTAGSRLITWPLTCGPSSNAHGARESSSGPFDDLPPNEVEPSDICLRDELLVQSRKRLARSGETTEPCGKHGQEPEGLRLIREPRGS
jgi:hypothetical protein